MAGDWIDDLEGSRRQVMALSVGVEGGMAVVAVLLGLVFGLPVAGWVVWSGTGLAWGLAGAAAMLVFLGAGRASRSGPVARLNRLMDRVVPRLFGSCRWWELMIVAILAGVGEEFLFRGVIQGGLVELLGGLMPGGPEWVPAVVALAVASIVFGFAHAVSREYVVFATVIGAFLGWMAIATGDLLAPIVAHAVYDFVALVWLCRKGSRT